MAGQQIAYLEAFVGADITSFRRAMGEVRSSLLDIGGISEGLRDTGRNLTYALTLPLIGAGATAIKFASDFDSAMRNVASISDDVAGDFDGFSQRVLEFGSNLRSGPLGAAEAFYEVFSAGVTDAQTAFEIAQQATYLSEAGLTDLDVTTRALITSMQAYNATAQDAAHYSDVWTQMVQLGVGSMDEFVTSIGRAVPTAANLGVSFDELGASAAFLTQRGLTTYNAATAVNAALTSLLAPTSEMRSALDEMGFSSGQAAIEQLGLLETMRRLHGVTGDNSEAQRELFNSMQAFRFAANIFNNFEDYADIMDEFAQSVDGATQEARGQQLQSFAAQFDLLKSAVSEFAITVGQQLLPIVTPLIQGITGFFQSLSATNPQILQLGIAIAAAVAAAGPLLWIIGTLMTPVGLLTGAIVALAGGLATGAINIDYIHNAISSAIPSFDDLLATLQRVVAFITDESASFHMEMGFAVDPNTGQVRETQNFVQDTFRDRIADAIRTFGPVIGQALQDMFYDAVAWVVNTGFPAVDDLVSNVIDTIAGVFDSSASSGTGNSTLYNAVRNFLDTGIGETLDNIGGFLQEHFPEISASLNTFFSNIGQWFIDEGIPTVARLLGYGIATLGSTIADLIRGLFGGVGKESPIIRAFRTGFERGWEDATKDLNLGSGLNQLVTLIVGGLGVLFLGAVFTHGVSAVLSSAFGLIFRSGIRLATPLFIPLGQTIINGISGVITAIGGSVIATAIAGVLTGVLAGVVIWNLIPESTRIEFGNNLWGLLGRSVQVGSDEFNRELEYNLSNNLGWVFENVFNRPDLAANAYDHARMIGSGFETGLQDTLEPALQDTENLLLNVFGSQGIVDYIFANFQAQLRIRREIIGMEFDNLTNATAQSLERMTMETGQNFSATTGILQTWSPVVRFILANVGGAFLSARDAAYTATMQMAGGVSSNTPAITGAVQNLATGISNIIAGIVNAWNSMLTLVGQNVTMGSVSGGGVAPSNVYSGPRPTTPTTVAGNNVHSSSQPRPSTPSVPRPSGRLQPAFATPGFLGAGQLGLVGDAGPELVRFGKPASLMPKSMYSGGSGGMNQINNIQIVTNDPQRLIEQLRLMGIDLKKGKRT